MTASISPSCDAELIVSFWLYVDDLHPVGEAGVGERARQPVTMSPNAPTT